MSLLFTFLSSLKSGGETLSRNSQYQTQPPTKYNAVSSEKLIETVRTRPKLTIQDKAAKAKILSSLGGKSGVVFEDKTLLIEYVSNADSLFAEIKNASIDFSKQKAINYLKDKGLSKVGICNFPLVFYLKPSFAQEYGKEKKEFNPIPDFCS